jgi:formate hydrogenlyase subunit 4
MSGMGGTVAAGAVQVGGMVAGAPLLLGLMRKTRSRLEGRIGPPIRQPWRDLWKLSAKQAVRADSASWILPTAPVLLVATAAVATLVAPLATTRPPLGRDADFFVVVFLLLVGSVFLALGALDPGTPFGGMGASRAMTIGALGEPVLLVAVLAFAIPAGTSNLPGVVSWELHHPGTLVSPQRILALAALAVVILAETGRLPVDNPSTHLELTMVHEAMVLEYAGPDLALVTLGESMRLALLLGLLVNLAVPWGVATRPGPAWVVVGAAALAAKVAVVGVAIAAFEVFIPKLRLFRVPELLAGGFVLALLATVTALVAS